MKSNGFMIFLVLIILLGGFYLHQIGAFPKSNYGVAPTGSPATTVSPSGSPSPSAASPNPSSQPTFAPNAKAFTINASNFTFDLKNITVKQGDTVRITFKVTQGFHNLAIDGYNQATPSLSAGSSAMLQFVAAKKGTFAYYCSVDSHRDLGMVGTLTVQ